VLARYDLFAAEYEARRAAALAEQTAASSHLEQNPAHTET
jgi:hypothetical protein